MAIERTYKEPYQALYFKDEGEKKGWWQHREVSGIIYPSILKADFSNLEGFKRIIEEFGIEGFSYLDEKKGIKNEYSLGQELIRFRKEKRPLPDHFIKKVYDRIKEHLLQEQTSIKLFHEWFMKGNHPIIHQIPRSYMEFGKPVKDSICVPALTMTFEKRWKPKNEKEKGVIKEMEKVLEALHRHVGFMQATLYTNAPSVRMIEMRDHPHHKAVHKTWFNFRCRYLSIPARCYAEMIDIIEDRKEVKYCELCGSEFIPSRKNEKYCNRWSLNTYQLPFDKRKTCKKEGPEEKFKRKNLNRRKEYKKLKNRSDYLNRKGEDKGWTKERKKELKKVEAELNQWTKENSLR